MKYLKKIGLGLLVCVLSLSLILQLFPEKASAAAPTTESAITGLASAGSPPARFINSSYIQLTIGSETYTFFDQNTWDTVRRFRLLEADSECYGQIDLGSGNGVLSPVGGGALTGQLDMDFHPPNGDCDGTNPNSISIQVDKTHERVFYEYVDPDTIRPLQDANNGIYRRATGAGVSPQLWVKQGDDSCANLMIVSTDGLSAETWKLEDNRSNGTDGLDTVPQPQRDILTPFFPSSCEVENSLPYGDSNGWVFKDNNGIWTANSFPLGNTAAIGVGGGTPQSPTGTNTTAGDPPEQSCESNDTSNLGWILCAIIRGIDGTLNEINSQVQNIMEIRTDNLTDLRVAWGNIRNIASILLVLFAMIMVISTAINVGPFDAYTIRKILPRMVAAVILMQISWGLMTFLIEVTNDVGKGITNLMLAPFGGDAAIEYPDVISQSVAGSGLISFNAVMIGLAGASALALGALGIASLALTTLASVIIGFAVLIIRNIVIISALMIAPFAIICYIIPGTEKFGKFWWDAFSKGLLMFPLIMVLFASGRIFAYVTAASDPPDTWQILQFVIVVAAYAIPYFLIPATFRLAGGAIATLGGMVNDRSRGFFDRNKKFRQGQVQKNFEGMQTGNRYRGNSWAARKLNSGLEIATNATPENIGFIPGKQMRSRMQALRSRNAYDEAREAREKNHWFQHIMGNEDYLEAGREASDVVRDTAGNAVTDALGRTIQRDGSVKAIRAYLASRVNDKGEKIYQGRDLEQAVGAITNARRSMSNESFNVAAAVNITSTGTGYGSGAGEMDRAIADAAHGDSMLATRMLAEMRGLAGNARRADLAGGGFGHRLGQLSRVREAVDRGGTYEEIKAVQDDVTSVIDRETLRTQSGGTIVSMKPKQLRERLAKVMTEDLHSDITAVQSEIDRINTDPSYTNDEQRAKAVANANRVILRNIGAIAGRYDLANQISPESAQVMADKVMSQEIDVSKLNDDMRNRLRSVITKYEEQEVTVPDAAAPGGTRVIRQMVPVGLHEKITVQQASEALASDPIYKEARKEYASSLQAQAAAAAGTPPPGTDPTEIPTGPRSL